MPKPYTAETRLYLNADKSAVVAEGSPDATYLLAGAGTVVSAEDVKKYDLKGGGADPAPAVDPPPVAPLTEAGSFQGAGDPPADDPAPAKKAVAPAEDKAVAGPETKGA